MGDMILMYKYVKVAVRRNKANYLWLQLLRIRSYRLKLQQWKLNKKAFL